jgi:hypothetical protein
MGVAGRKEEGMPWHRRDDMLLRRENRRRFGSTHRDFGFVFEDRRGMTFCDFVFWGVLGLVVFGLSWSEGRVGRAGLA